MQLRTSEIAAGRAGTLASTNELAGKRVSVQIDGGRTKLRGSLQISPPRQAALNADGLVISDAPGRSKPVAKRTFSGEWREPKLVTIFIHDEQGRLEKQTKLTIDGTFQGPDALAELVAMHLHRLGAAQAMSITFVSDGAVWIWDRIDQIVAQAGIPPAVTIYQVLDNCHAAHHISRALASLNVTAAQRLPLYRALRTQLRDGNWKHVVQELQQFMKDDPTNTELQTELNYLERHGNAGRLNYDDFRELGLPLGSGAIESSIRRVINLRLKGNGTFWLEDHAEEMLQLRALVITRRWDARLHQMRTRSKSHHPTNWHWTPRPMSCKTEPQTTEPQNPA